MNKEEIEELKDFTIDLTDIDISELDDLSDIFYQFLVEVVDISGWDISNVKIMNAMFANCEKLKKITNILWITRKTQRPYVVENYLKQPTYCLFYR